MTTDYSMSGNNDTHEETKLPAMKRDYRGSIITGHPRYIQASVDPSEDSGPSSTSTDRTIADRRDFLIPIKSALREYDLAMQRHIMKETMQLKLTVDKNEPTNSSKLEGAVTIVKDSGNDEKDYLQCQRRNRSSRLFTDYVRRMERVSRGVNIDDQMPSTSGTNNTSSPSIEEISEDSSDLSSDDCLDIEN